MPLWCGPGALVCLCPGAGGLWCRLGVPMPLWCGPGALACLCPGAGGLWLSGVLVRCPGAVVLWCCGACGLCPGAGVVRLCPSFYGPVVPCCRRSRSSVVQGVGCLSFASGPMASEPAPGLGFARFLLRTCKVGRGPCNDLLNDAGPWNRANRLYSAFQKSVVTNLDTMRFAQEFELKCKKPPFGGLSSGANGPGLGCIQAG